MSPAPFAQIATMLEGVSRKELSARAARLSAAYRAGGTSAGITDPLDGLAYLVARAPATHAAIRAAMARVAEVEPGFAPTSLLDIGAGPGTAAWAAREIWPAMDAVTLIEPNPVFRDLAARLLPEAKMIAGSLSAEMPRADLVTASYVLAELPETDAANIARDLWAVTDGLLMLIEPGTPSGFARIRAARKALIGLGGHVAAPCTHDGDCPVANGDWCHFTQRLPRSRDHLLAKAARVPFEDEPYAYVAVSCRPLPGPAQARIIAPVSETKAGITFALCDRSGLHAQSVARREKERFRAVRRKKWGDLF